MLLQEDPGSEEQFPVIVCRIQHDYMRRILAPPMLLPGPIWSAVVLQFMTLQWTVKLWDVRPLDPTLAVLSPDKPLIIFNVDLDPEIAAHRERVFSHHVPVFLHSRIEAARRKLKSFPLYSREVHRRNAEIACLLLHDAGSSTASKRAPLIGLMRLIERAGMLGFILDDMGTYKGLAFHAPFSIPMETLMMYARSSGMRVVGADKAKLFDGR